MNPEKIERLLKQKGKIVSILMATLSAVCRVVYLYLRFTQKVQKDNAQHLRAGDFFTCVFTTNLLSVLFFTCRIAGQKPRKWTRYT